MLFMISVPIIVVNFMSLRSRAKHHIRSTICKWDCAFSLPHCLFITAFTMTLVAVGCRIIADSWPNEEELFDFDTLQSNDEIRLVMYALTLVTMPALLYPVLEAFFDAFRPWRTAGRLLTEDNENERCRPPVRLSYSPILDEYERSKGGLLGTASGHHTEAAQAIKVIPCAWPAESNA
eukprot:gnl/TRDRNA2_/TRDRNA2_174987_c0_seq1.p1 gnl/TRDRNA2_/TRDRNA2_174987_c0~~gnl/TRDRNA2_/TRDRNA2_174987_c0_seq1.p1  ORF type:complete len:178 (-),score=15.23 gnl/TRDRNA2_/TRDRNA2_174987_c0_seq1:36-569(-)